MGDLKTVGESVEGEVLSTDPLKYAQKRQISRMREALVTAGQNPALARTALNNITVMRIYHQLARIIRYTEMCDKIEDKIYEALDCTLERSSPNNPTTWMILMNAQERLQNCMIASQKLLEPYLNVQSFTLVDLVPDDSTSTNTEALKLNAATRENIRSSAKAVLLELKQAAGGEMVDV